MLKKQTLYKIIAATFVLYMLCCIIFYFVSGDQLRRVVVQTEEMVQAAGDVGHLVKGKIIEQPFTIAATNIESVTLLGTSYDNDCRGTITIDICNLNGETLASQSMPVGSIPRNDAFVVQFDRAVNIDKNQPLLLRLRADTAETEYAGTVYYGNSVMLPRGEAQLEVNHSNQLTVNGEEFDGMLCFQVSGRREIWLGNYFWEIAILGGILLIGYSLRQVVCLNKGQKTKGIMAVEQWGKYKFLLEQLVARDFKTKYKRSILGVLWSFLNPLLTMTVQYIVFSTIFKSDIDNFPVYLLSGIVCFNFFSEVTSMALTSIVGNASLITKVYIPKVIYPLSRSLSSCINFLLSLVPLLLVMMITKTQITPAVALLPFAMLCLFFLSLGVGLILASLMVFFRDTQFLWNVISMMWMYMTPIFYPESIISGNLAILFKMNPLYHILRFFRTILLNGTPPEPQAYVICLIAAIVPLAVGLAFFKKTQDRFVLHI